MRLISILFHSNIKKKISHYTWNSVEKELKLQGEPKIAFLDHAHVSQQLSHFKLLGRSSQVVKILSHVPK